MSIDAHVPADFRKHGIKMPRQAADHVADIMGFMSIDNLSHSAQRAEREGRFADQDFYLKVIRILLQDYEDLERRLAAEQAHYPHAP